MREGTRKSGTFRRAAVFFVLHAVLAVAVVVILTHWVPQAEAALAEQEADIPLLTRFTIDLSNFVKSYWLLLLPPGLAALAIHSALCGWLWASGRRGMALGLSAYVFLLEAAAGAVALLGARLPEAG
jgi:hypothetical protein